MQYILSGLRRAVNDFNLIEANDRIGVGVSGGKDSLTLLKAMHAFSKFSPVPFSVHAITLTMGFPNTDTSHLENFYKDLGVPYSIVSTEIGPIIFDHRKEKNPCSLCANMRRGALNNTAKALGMNKVALGHHGDDAVETFLLCLLYEGRINSFMPKSYMSRADITVIRPLVYLWESDIRSVALKEKLPILHNPCPANGVTKRAYMKDLLSKIRADIPRSKEAILHSLWGSGDKSIWEKSDWEMIR